MDQVTVNMACNILDLALSHNYTKGRNYNCVIGGCCYIACRLNKTSHMLMDFSEAFAINVFSIGAVFVKLRDLFFNGKDADQMLPLVDPALYMARFAEKLEFGEMKEQVIMSALKLAQGMERSSLVTGRKPAGICAASLFVAARMYGFKRTIREIVLIVKVCGGTVRRRLRELADTELGDMTKDTFEGMATNPADPPSYNKRSRRRASIAPPVQLDAEDTPLLNEVVELIKASHEYDEENIDNLDDLDDDPDVIDAIQVTEEEKDFKNELWTMINSDWMEAQTHKDPSEYRPPKKKTKRGNQYDSPFKSENPADAVRKLVESKPQLSKRFNHDLVKDWFPEIEDE
ncbi:hypothetical protein BC833DRAFT_589676 [Globomyces pollinis-pini]|nr:hypothetical protein BC833DRAFT_589676 [Globomyces pollinis-pini]